MSILALRKSCSFCYKGTLKALHVPQAKQSVLGHCGAAGCWAMWLDCHIAHKNPAEKYFSSYQNIIKQNADYCHVMLITATSYSEIVELQNSLGKKKTQHISRTVFYWEESKE